MLTTICIQTAPEISTNTKCADDVKRQHIHVHRLEAKYQPFEQEMRRIFQEAPDVEVIGETGVTIPLRTYPISAR